MALEGAFAGVLLIQIGGWPGDDRLLSFVFALAFWGLVASAAWWLLFRIFRALSWETRTDIDNIVLRTVRTPLFAAITAYGLVDALHELRLGDNFDSAVRSVYAVVMVIVFFYLAWRITKELLLKWLKNRALETESRVDDLLVPVVNTVGPLIFFLVALAFILQALGVNIGLLLAGVGAISLVIGLAFQDTLSNLFSGIYLMIDPPFHDDDLIILPDGKVYRVEKVGLRMTQLYDMSNHALIFTPNSTLTRASIANITKPTVDMKVTSSVRSGMNVDPAKVKDLLNDILKSHRNILEVPAVRLATLRKRIDQLSLPVGAGGTELGVAIDTLADWHDKHAGSSGQLYASLLETRKELARCLSDAQTELRKLHGRSDTEQHIKTLQRVLAGATTNGSVAATGQERITQIDTAWDALAEALPPEQIETLRQALGSVEELDTQQSAIEFELATSGQTAQDELDYLLNELVEAGRQLSDALTEREFTKEAARIKLWVQNMAVVYCELEVTGAIESLNVELNGLIAWLHSLEVGGLNRHERARAKELFGAWGGMQTMEKRRVADLRRRIMRWVAWKEEEVLPTSEYGTLVAAWDRKLHMLSDKLSFTPSDDEELLDSYLGRTYNWLNSVHFLEPFEDWKLPGAGLKAFGDYWYEYGFSYYIDDIKLGNFMRQGHVAGDLLMDIYEVFRREGISIPAPLQAVPPPTERDTDPLLRLSE